MFLSVLSWRLESRRAMGPPTRPWYDEKQFLIGRARQARRDARQRTPLARTRGWQKHRSARLLGRQICRPLGKPLDAFLEASERCQTGLDRVRRDISQQIRRDVVAQTIQIIDKLATRAGE